MPRARCLALYVALYATRSPPPEAFAERVDGYRPQLLTYREVIHRMTGLPLTAIRCQLIFTHRCEVVEV